MTNERPITVKLSSAVSILVVFFIGLIVASCAGSDVVATADRCPPMAQDIVAEAGRKPAIKGDTAVAISGTLIGQVHAKNRALSRSIATYNLCRATGKKP